MFCGSVGLCLARACGARSGDFRDLEDFASAVGAAGGAGDVARDRSAAVGTGFEEGGFPALGHRADLLFGAGGASLRYGHGFR